MRITAPPPATNRLTKARSCPATTASSDDVGSSRMTSFTGVSVTEKARAISTICRREMPRSPTTSPGAMPWPGKISSSMPTISRPERRRQPKPLKRRMEDAGVLRHGQVRAERQFLEDAADAAALRQRRRHSGW